ncbi:MAG: DUF2202 domain-containing protein [Thiohalocapsa sp.]|nr:DUF2202 domain-containing protein [Thiohalocapsa sp.]MCF7989786.1 DUF2202 domain-containing protein [Thiohalocapsa sp.]
MKRTTLGLSIIALSAALTAGSAIAGGGPRGQQPMAPVTPTLDDAEAAALLFMREEEKLARDVYTMMDDAWNAALFVNIATSEQRHMDSVKRLLDRYALPDPALEDAVGYFSDASLQALYDELLSRGEGSYLDALQVGGLIEEVDIEDLADAIAATDNTDLRTLYDNLMRGSRNHLRAFAAEIERMGVPYEAQHLEQADVDAIIDSPMERGGSNGGQNGQGGNSGGGKGGRR